MRRAFTIIEVIMTVGIFTMIMITIVSSVLFFYRANTSSIEQSYQVDSARKGVNLLVRDIREATYSDNGAYPLAEMGTSSITFFSDTDRDNATEKIRYSLMGTTIYRNVVDPTGTPATYTGGGATSTMSDYVRNKDQNTPVFRYYNASSTEITNSTQIADVVSVTVNIIVNISPYRMPGEFTLRSSATLRNLRAQ